MTIKYTEKFNKLWHIYDNTLAHGKKGSKFTALTSFNKFKEDEQDRIIFDTQALMKHFKQQVKPDRLPHLSTWINQRYFEQEIPSTAEKRIVEDEKICSNCGENPVHGSAYILCSRCIPSRMDARLRSAWQLTNLSRSSETLAQDCRDYCKSKGYLIGRAG